MGGGYTVRAMQAALSQQRPLLQQRLGLVVRRLRERAGYSQESFADVCHLHRNYIGAVERGETNITLRNIEVIARGLELHAWELLRLAEREGG